MATSNITPEENTTGKLSKVEWRIAMGELCPRCGSTEISDDYAHSLHFPDQDMYICDECSCSWIVTLETLAYGEDKE